MLHPYRMEGYIIPPVSIFYSLNGPDMAPLLLIDAYTIHCLLYCCQRVKQHCEDMPSKLVTEKTAGSVLFFVISVFEIHQSFISLARFVHFLVYIYIYLKRCQYACIVVPTTSKCQSVEIQLLVLDLNIFIDLQWIN